jgi:hypothetical protein
MTPNVPTAPLCPDCRAPLTGASACAACGLTLLGPTAARLWQVDQQVLTLREERTTLLSALRTDRPPVVPVATWTPPAPAVRKESSPQQVQNTLLGLGALLLALAGVVFAAVTYRYLGTAGRAAILLTLTAIAAAAPVRLAARALTASAEAVTAVALVLGVTDAWALRRAGLGDSLHVQTYSAVATGVLALASASLALSAPLRTARFGAVVLAHFPVIFVLARTEASLPVIAVTLAAVAAVDLVAATHQRVPADVRRLAAGLGGVAVLASLGASVGAIADDDRAGAVGLLALAGLAAAGAYRVTESAARNLLAAIAVPLVAGAAWASVRPQLATDQQPLVVMAVALLALQVSALLPKAHRTGPVSGALAVATVALVSVGESVVLALAGPFTWLSEPWNFTGSDARAAFVGERWDGTVVTLVILAAAAVAVLAAGAVLDRIKDAALPAAVLLLLSALVLPLGLSTSFNAALAILLALGIALAACGLALLDRQRTFGLALVGAGFASTLLAAVWSVADQDATLLVLPLVALAAAALAVRLPGALTGTAALLLGAELAAYGASRDLAAEQVGGLLLAAPALAVAGSYLLRGAHRLGLEAAAALLATTTIVLAVDDPGWLSWTLAASGLMGLAVAIRADRRLVGLVGGLLLSASSWVRLADANVHAPEPYVAPLALAALLFGYLRRRETPGTSSFVAYGAGLSVALVPSLLKAFSDEDPTRSLLLLVAAAAVVLVGAKDRLQAPLVIGAIVVVLDGLHLLAPYASALPRWTLLAGAGTVLVVLGATYEQRRRDVTRLRASFDSWA